MPKHGRGHRKRDTHGRARKTAVSEPAALREITVSAREIQNRGYPRVPLAPAAMSMNVHLGSRKPAGADMIALDRRSPARQLKGAPGSRLDAKSSCDRFSSQAPSGSPSSQRT
jgi:hypothetical protein